MAHGKSSLRVVHELEQHTMLHVLPAPQTAVPWHVEFGHITNYGGGYYSYLFARALAAKIWKQLFYQDPLSRDAGHHLQKGMLEWGGGRDG